MLGLSNTWVLEVKLLSRVWLFATPWTVAHQAPWSMGFSRHEYWSGLPFTLSQLLSEIQTELINNLDDNPRLANKLESWWTLNEQIMRTWYECSCNFNKNLYGVLCQVVTTTQILLLVHITLLSHLNPRSLSTFSRRNWELKRELEAHVRWGSHNPLSWPHP